MARRKPKGNNYEAIGEWLINYWYGNDYQTWLGTDMMADPPAPNLTALKALMHHDGDEDFPFSYDREKVVHINIPLGPQATDLEVLKSSPAASTSYKRDLGYVILGGCRR